MDRLTIPEAARKLGITDAAVRKRYERGTLKGEKGDDGRIYVFVDAGDTTRPDEASIVEVLRDEIGHLRRESERKDAIIMSLSQSNAELSRTIRQLEALQEPPGAPETATEEPVMGEPRPGIRGAEEATERRWATPVARLPQWQWVLGGALSLLAFPASELLAVVIQSTAGLSVWLAMLVVLLPGIFGYWVGLKLRNFSFWRHVAPIAGLLIVGAFIGSSVLWSYIAWITAWLYGFGVEGDPIGVTLARDPSLVGILVVTSPAALYSFAALLGNARQRRNREKLSKARPSDSRWSSRQEAMIGLAGTIISALIGLIGNIYW